MSKKQFKLHKQISVCFSYKYQRKKRNAKISNFNNKEKKIHTIITLI